MTSFKSEFYYQEERNEVIQTSNADVIKETMFGKSKSVINVPKYHTQANVIGGYGSE